jgi:SAM-dependent methyltransferase
MGVDDLRSYYENLYRQGFKRNPAEEIYSRLRLEVIREFLVGTGHPSLIVGAGTAPELGAFHAGEKPVLIDFAYRAMRKAPTEICQPVVADLLRLPFPSSTFRTVVCSEVLEHIPDIRSAIGELHRVMAPGAVLIVSSPNWISLFGLARWVGEKILRVQLHSSGQPYDDWKTPARYQRELSPGFKVERMRGVWFLPPLHFRGKGLSDWAVRSLYRVCAPIERAMSRALPYLGHILLMKCKRVSLNGAGLGLFDGRGKSE